MNIKLFFNILIVMGQTIVFSCGEDAKPQTPIISASWEVLITRSGDYKDKNVSLDGWLSVQINEGLPVIELFSTKEAFEYRRPMKGVVVDRESFHTLLKSNGINTTLDYAAFNGCYVVLNGIFRPPNSGEKHYFVGAIGGLTDLYLQGDGRSSDFGKAAFHRKTEQNNKK